MAIPSRPPEVAATARAAFPFPRVPLGGETGPSLLKPRARHAAADRPASRPVPHGASSAVWTAKLMAVNAALPRPTPLRCDPAPRQDRRVAFRRPGLPKALALAKIRGRQERQTTIKT